MADVSAVVAPLFKLLAPLIGQAVGAFLRTTVGMICLGTTLAVGSFIAAARVSALHGRLAALVVVLTCALIGGILASKRAVGAALTRGLRAFKLGTTTTQWLFSRMLGVDDQGVHGSRGGTVATSLERLPLAAAEQRLAGAVDRAMAPDPAATGLRAWFLRTLQRRLLAAISRITLAEFRSVAAAQGGVDLVRVRDELATRMDAVLLAYVEGTTRKLTISLVVAAVVLDVATTVAIRQISW